MNLKFYCQRPIFASMELGKEKEKEGKERKQSLHPTYNSTDTHAQFKLYDSKD